jgi:uncharacterized repeat protein (TIGR03803 family)
LADYGGDANGNCDQGTCGTVYRLAKQSNGTWKFQLIHSFTGGADGGNPNPLGALAFDSAGNLYGGSQDAAMGNGLVFEFHHASTGWNEKILHNFTSDSTGRDPLQGMVFDSAGNLYGITNFGGSTNNGTVFELTPTASGPWKETVLYNFQGGTDGASPTGPLTFDPAGNLYGTTVSGGGSGLGTVYELSPGSGGWTETILHSFAGGTGDGSGPQGGVVRDAAGNLYGVTPFGGTIDDGVAYEIIP